VNATRGARLGAEIARQPAVLGRVLGLNALRLGRARELLAPASTVRFAGIGSSGHAAAYGCAAYDVLAGTASLLAAPGFGVPQPPPRPGEALVVVSQSGRTPSLVELARTAKAAGQPLVAVTNAPGSELDRLADVALDTDAAPEECVAATGSMTASMLLLRDLAAPLAEEQLRLLAAAVRAAVAADGPQLLPGGCAQVVIDGPAGRWVAAEVALKLAEIAELVVSAHDLIGFLHGPVAAGGPVLAFVDPADPNAAAISGHARIHWEGDGAVDPWLRQLVRVVAGQRVALRYAESIGLDAERARGLSKVTCTA